VYGFDYSCIKSIALREPLVDTVDVKSVVTQPFPLKVRRALPNHIRPAADVPPQHIDLRTAQKEDLAFNAEFSLQVTRNDCASGLRLCAHGD
jgi:protein arginine N-methyltransferase 1